MHLGSSVQYGGAGIGLNAYILCGGDGHIKGTGVALVASPLVLGVVPQAVPDICASLRRDGHLLGAAVVRIINLGVGGDVRRGDRRIKGKGLTEEAPVGIIVMVGDAVAPRRNGFPVKRCSFGEACILIGIQPAVAHAHEGAALQVLDGIGLFTVLGQLRGHQHDFVSAFCADVVRLLKGHVLIGIAGLLGHAVVPLDAVAHIAQGRPVLHGVVHRHQHHIPLNIGEGLGEILPARAASAALRVLGIVPVEERALIIGRDQRPALALSHNMDVVELRLYNLGKVDAAGSARRYLMIHDQALGSLHGGHALRRIDILHAAPGVDAGRAIDLDTLIDAAVAAVHIRSQRGVCPAADGPVPFYLLGVVELLVPIVDVGGEGLDLHALLGLDDVGPGALCTVFDMDVALGVVKLQVLPCAFVVALNVALVPDVQEAGGVHREGVARFGGQNNVVDDILVGNDLQRGVVQQLQPLGVDGPVDICFGVCLPQLVADHLDLHLGVVLDDEVAAAGIDADNIVGLGAKGAAVHLDVHGGAGAIIFVSAEGDTFAAVNAMQRAGRSTGLGADEGVEDVQRAAAGDGDFAGGPNGAGVLLSAGAHSVQLQLLAGGEEDLDAGVVGVDQAVAVKQAGVVLHRDLRRNAEAELHHIHIEAGAVQVQLALEIEKALIVKGFVVAVADEVVNIRVLVGRLPRVGDRAAYAGIDVLTAMELDRLRVAIIELKAGIAVFIARRQHSGLGDGLLLRLDEILRSLSLRGRLGLRRRLGFRRRLRHCRRFALRGRLGFRGRLRYCRRLALRGRFGLRGRLRRCRRLRLRRRLRGFRLRGFRNDRRFRRRRRLGDAAPLCGQRHGGQHGHHHDQCQQPGGQPFVWILSHAMVPPS